MLWFDFAFSQIPAWQISKSSINYCEHPSRTTSGYKDRFSLNRFYQIRSIYLSSIVFLVVYSQQFFSIKYSFNLWRRRNWNTPWANLLLSKIQARKRKSHLEQALNLLRFYFPVYSKFWGNICIVFMLMCVVHMELVLGQNLLWHIFDEG